MKTRLGINRSPIISFGRLKNLDIITIHQDKTVQLLNESNIKTIQLNIPEDPLLINPKILMFEMPNRLLALAYTYGYEISTANSHIYILDLNLGLCAASKIIVNERIIEFRITNDNFLFVLLHFQDKPLIFSYENEELVMKDNTNFPQERMVESITLSNGKIIYYDMNARLKLLNVQLKEEKSLILKEATGLTFITNILELPNNQLSFIRANVGNVDHGCFINICDATNLTLLESIPLKSQGFSRYFTYSELILLENTYLAVGGRCNNDQYCFQLFDISKPHAEKINEVWLDSNLLLPSIKDDHLITCNKLGEITLHHLLPRSKDLRTATESALTMDKNLIWPRDVINIITDYAGFFRVKSKKNNFSLKEVCSNSKSSCLLM